MIALSLKIHNRSFNIMYIQGRNQPEGMCEVTSGQKTEFSLGENETSSYID